VRIPLRILTPALVLAVPLVVAAGCASGPRRTADATVAPDPRAESAGDGFDLQVVPSGPGRFIVTAIRRLGGRAATGDAAVRASSPKRAREHGRLASARAWLLLGREAVRAGTTDVARKAALYGLDDLGADTTATDESETTLLDRLEKQVKAYRKSHFADFAE